MRLIKKLSAILIIIVILAGTICIPSFSVSVAEEFEITNISARTGSGGAFVKDAFSATFSGLNRNVTLFEDKPSFSVFALPSEFVNCGYILTKNAVVNSMVNQGMTDALTFNINKSATVYVVGWNDQVPVWVVAEGWEQVTSNELKVKNNDNNSLFESKVYFKKHFDVSGENADVSVGGVASGRYFTVIIRPDDLEEQTSYPFSEEDLANEELEKDVLKSIGESVVLYKNISSAYVNGRKVAVDINSSVTPVIKDGVTYLPLRFITESFNGNIEYNSTTHCADFVINNKKFNIDLNTGKATNLTDNITFDAAYCIVSNRTLVPLRIITENAGLNVIWHNGLIVVAKEKKKISDTELNKISALFVTPMSMVDIKLKYAKPGDTVTVAEGTYPNVCLYIKNYGCENAPVTIKSENPETTKITGYVKIVINGEYVVFDGFYFDQCKSPEIALVNLSGGVEYSRVTNCYFYKCRTSGRSGILIQMTKHSANNRVDHNVFEAPEALSIVVDGEHSPTGDSGKVENNLIDHNYFKDVKDVAEVWNSDNGLEPLRIGSGSRLKLNTVMEYNLFENVIADGAEIISNKGDYSTIRYNTFINNYQSGLCLRGGQHNNVYGNYFINGRTGIRLYDYDNKIFDNYFYNIYRDSIRVPSTDDYNYAYTNQLVIANNTIVNSGFGGLVLGDNAGGIYILPPRNVKILNNHIVTGKGHAVRNAFVDKAEYKNNIIYAYGNGSDEEAKKIEGENNLYTETPLVFDGIYTPENMDMFENKGVYVEETAGLLGIDSFDIGVNNIKGEGRKGLLTYNDVGPEDKWWVSHLKMPPADYTRVEPEHAPQCYTPSKNSVIIAKDGGEFDTLNLAGFATYSDGYSYMVNPDTVNYKVSSGTENIYIENGIIKGKSGGAGEITAEYKGKTSVISVEVKEDTYYKEISGKWDISGNSISCNGEGQKAIIDRNTYLKDDYVLSFKYNADGGDKDAYIILGDKDYGVQNNMKNPVQTEYAVDNIRYIIGFGKNDSNRGIFRYDGWNNLKLGNLLDTNEEDKEYDITIKVKDGVISVKSDGKLIGTAETNDVKGSVGFGAYTSSVEFKDIKLTEDLSVNKPEIIPLELETEVTDFKILKITARGLEDREDILYKLYANGIWVGDGYNNNIPDNKIDVYDDYIYTVKAFDNDGNIAGEGMILYNGTRAPEESFYLDNVLVRLGRGEQFIDAGYRYKNFGFDNGSYVFWDREYYYQNVPEKFKNAAFIMPDYGSRSLAYCRNDALDEWIKFDIHNKSVTVYLVIFGSALPGWLYDQQWKISVSDIGWKESTGAFCKASFICSRHYDLKKGESQTITLGGIGSQARFTYGIILVPDKE